MFELHDLRDTQLSLKFDEDQLNKYLKGLRNLVASLKVESAQIKGVNQPNSNNEILTTIELICRPKVTIHDECCFPDVLQALHQALQYNYDAALISILSTTVALLQIFDVQARFRQYGITLCKAILQRPQVKLLARCLGFYRQKERVVALALELLVEITSFDGGTIAWLVRRHGDLLFDHKLLLRNIRLQKLKESKVSPILDDGSARTSTCRYLLANFRYQSCVVKVNILQQRSLIQAIYDNLANDPPELVEEILKVTKTCILQDTSLPLKHKGAVWTLKTLKALTTLLRQDSHAFEKRKQYEKNQRLAFELVIMACQNREAGLLISNTNLHLPNSILMKDIMDHYTDPLQLIQVELYSFNQKMHLGKDLQIMNRVLGDYVISLHAHIYIDESQILVEALQAAPELVAYYFLNKTSISSDPKLSATWLGNSLLLLSIINLSHCHIREDWPPPPTNIIIESIIPLPLSQKYVRRSLTHKCEIIRFRALQCLIAAFRKMKAMYHKYMILTRGKKNSIWKKAASHLLSTFSYRCPKLQDVITFLRNLSPAAILQREAALALLELYYEITPQIGIEERLDISQVLYNILQHAHLMKTNVLKVIRLINLRRVINIAERSRAMRWFQRSGSMDVSLFTSLLAHVLENMELTHRSNILQLLSSNIQDYGIMQGTTSPTAFDAAYRSLLLTDQPTRQNVLVFFDECCIRCNQKGITYEDDLDNLIMENKIERKKPISLVWIVINEQIRYVRARAPENAKIVSRWIASYLEHCLSFGEDEQILAIVRDSLTSDNVNTGFDLPYKLPKLLPAPQSGLVIYSSSNKQVEPEDNSGLHSSISVLDSLSRSFLVSLPSETLRYPGLHRCMYEDIEQSITDGTIADLIICLSSPHESVRKEALINLKKFLYKLELSTFTERQQLWILLSELEETGTALAMKHPLPYIITTFAKHSVLIVTNPRHMLYPKVNKFLNNSPSWNIRSFISSWSDSIFYNVPDQSDSYFEDVAWFLGVVLEGSRTCNDMELLRTSGIFEHVLALYESASVSEKVKQLILGLLWRANSVGGSTTLITRSGILCWIESQIVSEDSYSNELCAIAMAIYDSCNQEKINNWAADNISEVIERIKSTSVRMNPKT